MKYLGSEALKETKSQPWLIYFGSKERRQPWSREVMHAEVIHDDTFNMILINFIIVII